MYCTMKFWKHTPLNTVKTTFITSLQTKSLWHQSELMHNSTKRSRAYKCYLTFLSTLICKEWISKELWSPSLWHVEKDGKENLPHINNTFGTWALVSTDVSFIFAIICPTVMDGPTAMESSSLESDSSSLSSSSSATSLISPSWPLSWSSSSSLPDPSSSVEDPTI